MKRCGWEINHTLYHDSRPGALHTRPGPCQIRIWVSVNICYIVPAAELITELRTVFTIKYLSLIVKCTTTTTLPMVLQHEAWPVFIKNKTSCILSRSNLHQLIRESIQCAISVWYQSDVSSSENIYEPSPMRPGPAPLCPPEQTTVLCIPGSPGRRGSSPPLSSNLFPFSFNFRLQSRVPAHAVTLRGSSIQ